MGKKKKDVDAKKTGVKTNKDVEIIVNQLGFDKDIRFYINNKICLKGLFALRALKTKYGDDLHDMYSDMPVLRQIDNELDVFWKDLEPINIKDVIDFTEDTDKRREMFQFFPTRLMFKNAEVVHNVTKITYQTDQYGVEHKIENHYELVRRKSTDLLGKEVVINEGREYIYAVKVNCVTTGITYYLMVDSDMDFCKPGKYNAAAAVAWTALCPITNPKALYRQGEVMLWERNEDSVDVPFDKRKHLTEDEYFSLLKFQS